MLLMNGHWSYQALIKLLRSDLECLSRIKILYRMLVGLKSFVRAISYLIVKILSELLILFSFVFPAFEKKKEKKFVKGVVFNSFKKE